MGLTKIIHLEGYIQTIYMAIYPNKILLLDGCCRSDVSQVLDYIKNTLKRPITDLKTVVITHMHPDHAGGALAFKKATGCTIVSANKKSQWYGGIPGRTLHIIDIILTYYVASRLQKPFKFLWYAPNLSPDAKVKEGDSIPHFEDWKVIETPGHTDRDLSLYHPATNNIYVADLIIKLRDKYVSPLFVYKPITYRQSIKKVKALEPKFVLLAHGGSHHIKPEEFESVIVKAPKESTTVKKSIKRKLLWWYKGKDKIDDTHEV